MSTAAEMTKDRFSKANPIRLLLISHTYPPVLGGSEVEAQRICTALLQRGHQVTVLCSGGAPMPRLRRWTDPGGVPVRIFGHCAAGWRRDYTFALGVAWTLLRERRNYQVVYFLMQGLHLATGLPAARWLGKPILMKISGSGHITVMGRSWLARLELKWLRKWAHRLMVLNPGMREEALAAGFDPSRLYWMPNPIDANEFAPCSPERRRELRARLDVPAQAVVIVFTGRLAPEKQLTYLIEAFALAANEAPEAMLVFIGDGPERETLEQAARRSGCGARIRFPGRQSSGETRNWLQASDIFALVSCREGFSCALAEAMSVGLPAVVTNIPANTQLIEDGVHGLHAAVSDAASIGAALLRLVRNEALRLRMGGAARRRVLQNYSTDQVVVRYEELFSAALGSTA